MRKLIALMVFLVFAQAARAQNIPITAPLSSADSAPLGCKATAAMPSDADFTLLQSHYTCSTLLVTSSVSLTATRNIIAPFTLGRQFWIMNSTTGGRAIVLKGATGAGVTIPNGSGTLVNTPDGVNYYSPILPITTTINTVACVSGSSCTLPTTCGGAACPNGNQVSVLFTTTASLALAASLTAGATSIQVTSTTGYPSVGCGVIQNVGNEYVCWSSIDPTHLLGVTRGLFGTGATSWTTAAIIGIVYLQGPSITAQPAFIVFNNSSTSFPSGLSASSTTASTGSYANFVQANNYVGAGQVRPFGGNPTMVAGAAAGTSPTCTSITGVNQIFVITCTTGTLPVVGTLATITFATTPVLSFIPISCTLYPRDNVTSTAMLTTPVFTTAPTLTSWAIGIGGTVPLAASTTYTWSGLCF